MSFTKLAPKRHKCDLPSTRDDASPLQVGDEWYCDEIVEDDSACGLMWRWCRGFDIVPDWMPIIPAQAVCHRKDQQ